MADGFTLDVSELDDYAKGLVRHSNVGARHFDPIVDQAVAAVVKEAVRTVARRQGPHTHSEGGGHLWQNIRPGPSGSGRSASEHNVEAAKHYAGFLEFGTVKMSPRPFMRPALAKVRRSYLEALVTEAKDSLRVLKVGSRRALRGVIRFGE